jgi:hypothetical protein
MKVWMLQTVARQFVSKASTTAGMSSSAQYIAILFIPPKEVRVLLFSNE